MTHLEQTIYDLKKEGLGTEFVVRYGTLSNYKDTVIGDMNGLCADTKFDNNNYNLVKKARERLHNAIKADL